MSGKKYAVAQGRSVGIYDTWAEAKAQVDGYSGSQFKSFKSHGEAAEYLSSRGVGGGGGSYGKSSGAYSGGASSRSGYDRPPYARNSSRPHYSSIYASGGGGYGSALPSAAPSYEDENEAPISPSGSSSVSRGHMRLEFDGASRSNPGRGGLGAALYDSQGQEVQSISAYLGQSVTSNEAEYSALIAGMRAALQAGCEHLTVRGDSTLVKKQVTDEWPVNAENLKPFHREAQRLAGQFRSFRITQVPRSENARADELSNKGIDDHLRGETQQVWKL